MDHIHAGLGVGPTATDERRPQSDCCDALKIRVWSVRPRPWARHSDDLPSSCGAVSDSDGGGEADWGDGYVVHRQPDNELCSWCNGLGVFLTAIGVCFGCSGTGYAGFGGGTVEQHSLSRHCRYCESNYHWSAHCDDAPPRGYPTEIPRRSSTPRELIARHLRHTNRGPR